MKDSKIELYVYTDGSHSGDKGVGTGKRYIGIGAWCHYENKEYEISQECTYEFVKQFGLTEEESKIMSNPTAEFIGFAFALKTLQLNIAKSELDVELTFHIDYVGVINWMEESWKAKKSYIKKIKEYCSKIID